MEKLCPLHFDPWDYTWLSNFCLKFGGKGADPGRFDKMMFYMYSPSLLK
jgi:hypothetical protein